MEVEQICFCDIYVLINGLDSLGFFSCDWISRCVTSLGETENTNKIFRDIPKELQDDSAHLF